MLPVSVILLSYLLGSLPFGLILTRAAGLGDIRSIGSGNIGATNVLRTGNKKLAIATLLLDALKGAVCVILVRGVIKDENLALLAGFCAMVGHVFPVWLKFKGGKGVATALGTILAANLLVGGVACAVWLMMAALFRFSSLASMVALLASPALALLLQEQKIAILGLACAMLVVFRHHANIQRLMKGTEPKLGKKGKVTQDAETNSHQ